MPIMQRKKKLAPFILRLKTQILLRYNIQQKNRQREARKFHCRVQVPILVKHPKWNANNSVCPTSIWTTRYKKVNCGLCHCISFYKSKNKLNLIELIETVNGFTAWFCTWFELTDFQIEPFFHSLDLLPHEFSVLCDKNKYRNAWYAYDIWHMNNEESWLSYAQISINIYIFSRKRCWKVENYEFRTFDENSFGFYFDFRYFGDIMNWIDKTPHIKKYIPYQAHCTHSIQLANN